ncbi:MAG: L-cysteine:1D-myo-inositol 2-amino-2-deoxy-alpha-D-glucopyranoside ligase [Acidimicrobiales bacterium]|nr:MAG: L-cysteine:1D-myo-inositol 2-amino-2-deoxy-alpha-D-glucopyranoside ligase [Acidimicrobiales bacterium]
MGAGWRYRDAVRLYDTARGEVVPFEPGNDVSIYVCGITPYDSTHLGHANTYLTYDLLIRRLEDLGHTVRLVRNITDVDDSILPKARELGIDFLELAAAETARFHGDMEALDTRPVHAEPHATKWIAEMVDLITTLDANGHVYVVGGTVFFDVATFPSFGSVSGYDEATMIEFAAERGGRPDDPRQRNPLDFVLWQPSLDDEPSWDSPWGAGRPGWHIECSAMSMGILGTTIDLHGGGSDLIFPHHECERAQSEAATGEPFVRHWMHCGMVAYEGTKMSKSLGNLVFVSELSKTADPRAIRLALMGHHYRDDWEWFDGHIEQAAALLDHLLTAAEAASGPDPAPYAARVRAALDDDLDSPTAKTALTELADAITAGGDDPSAPTVLAELGALLGVALDRPAAPVS